MRKDQKERFWEKHYKYYDFFQNKLDWYTDTIKFHLNNTQFCKTILDVGAGSGNLTIQLAFRGKVVTAIDNEPFALEKLKTKAKQNKFSIQVIQDDVSSLPFENNYFDGVTSMFLLPFVEHNEKHLREVYRVLKPKGIFSISMWAPVQNPSKILELRGKVEKKFTDSGVLPKYQNEWDSLLETSKVAAQEINTKNITKEIMEKNLSDIGFKQIIFYLDVAYDNYAYFITAEK